MLTPYIGPALLIAVALIGLLMFGPGAMLVTITATVITAHYKIGQ